MPRDAITYGPAESRYTRTPIGYHGARLADQPGAAGYYRHAAPLRKARIDVHFDPQADSPERVRQVQRHEDIHAAMRDDPAPDSLFGSDSPYIDRILSAFDSARRSGAPNVELPAYLGAGELDAVSDADRASFLDDYKRGLSPAKRALFERMQMPDARPMLARAPLRDLMLRPPVSPGAAR